MALGLSYRCGCGVNYKVYMPKRKIFGEIVNRVVDWQAVDAREEAAGEGGVVDLGAAAADHQVARDFDADRPDEELDIGLARD